MSQKLNQTRTSYDGTEEQKGIAVSYYFVDDRHKIWIRSPLKADFVIENPYTGDDRFSSREGLAFKIPWLKQFSSTYNIKSAVLIACLWLKDYKPYTDKLVTTGYEFYRCLTKDVNNNWILIPLYTEMGMHNTVRNPILLYHVESFERTLIIKNYDLLYQLCDMFNTPPHHRLINAFSVIINDKTKWLVQFPPAPAMFL